MYGKNSIENIRDDEKEKKIKTEIDADGNLVMCRSYILFDINYFLATACAFYKVSF